MRNGELHGDEEPNHSKPEGASARRRGEIAEAPQEAAESTKGSLLVVVQEADLHPEAHSGPSRDISTDCIAHDDTKIPMKLVPFVLTIACAVVTNAVPGDMR